MKYLLSLAVLFINITLINAQSWKSSSVIMGDNDITIIQSKPSTNGSTVVMGYFLGYIESESAISFTSYGGRDYFVAKFDQTGTVVWMNQLGSDVSDYVGGGIGAASDGSVYVTGGFKNWLKYTPDDSIQSAGAFDAFFAKYDVDGNVVWCRNTGSSVKNVRTNMLRVDNAGDILMSGFFTDSIVFDPGLTLYSTDGVDDYFYGKFDPITGDRIWVKKITGIDNTFSGRIFDAAATDDAYIFIGSYTDSVGLELDTLVSMNHSFDVHLIKTDFLGNVTWIRSIKGNLDEYSYAVTTDPVGDIYVAGYYLSPALAVDSTDVDAVTINGNKGGEDLLIAKYSSSGTLQWIRTAGGTSRDKIFDIDYFDNAVHVAGLFTDSLFWGGVELTTAGGLSDQDGFYGSIDLDGNWRSAKGFGGRNNSTEEMRSIFNGVDGLSVVISSNSDLLVLGNDIYTNPLKKYFVAVGNIGCLPIELSLVSKTDVDCFGDSTGTILLNASGGFDSPYSYSIDNGLTYQSSGLFDSVPAGTYETAVYGKENCVSTGPQVTILQESQIVKSSLLSDSVSCYGLSDGAISLSVTGGVAPYSFSVDDSTTFPYSTGDISNLSPGEYRLAVMDKNDCVVMFDTVTIYQPDTLSMSVVLDKDTLECNSDADGTITLTVTGGTQPYMYSVDGGTAYSYSANVISDLVAGEYYLAVKDMNDCSIQGDTVAIVEPDPLTISLVSRDDKHGDDLGDIVVEAAGETGTYTFTISPAEGNQDVAGAFSDLPAGTYTIEVTDDNCATTASLVETVVGLSNMQIREGNIYPNPSNGIITVEFNTDKPEVALEVVSISGQRVMNMQVFSNGGAVNTTFDMSSFAKGTYLIRVDGETLSNGVILK